MNLRHAAALSALLVVVSGCASQGATQSEATAGEVVTQDVATVATPDGTTAMPEADKGVAGQTLPSASAAPETDAVSPAELAPQETTARAHEPGATQAEEDFEALYGTAAEGAVAAPLQIRDPWEKYNRKVHDFNNAMDRALLRPVAKAYNRVVPKPIRTGVANFFRNLGQPVTALNALLQGKPGVAGNAVMRFAVNSTFGLGGLLDPASKLDIPTEQEDFGQTLGHWGWKTSRYVELPLFGPRTVRDVFGMVVDRPLNVTRNFDPGAQTGLGVLQVVDIRTQLLSIDSMREGAADDYLLYRDSWMQRRNYQIFGDNEDGGESVPSYLLTAPVPVAPMTKPEPSKEKKKKRRGVSRPPRY